MKFTAQKSAFLSVLAHASRIVEKRNTIPILSNVLIQADGRQVNLKATDLDLEVTLHFEAEVEVAGGTTVPAALLYDIVRKMPDKAEISFEMKGNHNVEVKSGRSRFTLQCLPESDFPDLNAGTFETGFDIDTVAFRGLITKTQFAISTEETRYYLNGIYLTCLADKGSDVLRAVATDGHRLAYSGMPAPDGAKGMPGVIIPRKTVGELQKLLETEKTAHVSVSQNKIRFQIGSIVVTSKLIDGTFPDYDRVVPKNNNKVVFANKKTFAEVIDRVSIVSSERGRAVKLKFEDRVMSAVVNNPDSGSASDEMEIDYDADAMEIGFNAKYLNDILSNIEGDKVRIALEDGGAPAVFRLEEDHYTLFVLMPMRV